MDFRLIIDALGAVAMLFGANWIRAMQQDVRTLVRTVATHGERLAVLESQVRDLRGK